MITTQLPAGLTGKSVEMYSLNSRLMALTNGVSVPAVQLDYVKHPVLAHLMARPEAHKRIKEWVGDNVDDQIERYGQCLWGAFSLPADINEEGVLSDPEFIQCSRKGHCEYEKDVCGCFKIGDENHLSKAEERILPHVLWADRIIGEKLCVSPHTVTTQFKSIKKKLNIQTKSELVDWANLNGIKLCK